MIARLLLIVLFVCLWLPVASFMLGNASIAPPLAAAKLYGPMPWKPTGRDIFFNHRHLPEFVVFGVTTSGDARAPVALTTDFFHWAAVLSHRGATPSEKLFATDVKTRPFVTDWDIEHDAGLWLHLGSLRVSLMFFLWSLLTAALPVMFWLWITTDAGRVISPQERWRRDEAFQQKVKDIEIDYKDRPAALRSHTVMLAFMGYGVLFGSILLLICTGVGLAVVTVTVTQVGGLAGLVMMVPVGFALKLFRSLLSPRYGDNGVRLQPNDAPALFAMLRDIQEKGKGPPFERVFITSVLNASVSRSTGKLGFFGFGPVTLSLGLPLMQALTPGQMEAVVGHEYGHVAAKDNAFGQWVYRIRNSWLYLGERLKTEQLWYILRLNRFYQWFLGFFSAYSFTLSRLCEYEADAFAGRIVGNKQAAEALIAVDIYSERMNRDFWANVWQKAKFAPEPAETPFRQLGGFFRAEKDVREDLLVMEHEQTGFKSTHPATVERVRALGMDIAPPPPLTESAAARLLGSLELALAAAFDRSWQSNSRDAWREKYQRHEFSQKRLDELVQRGIGRLSRDELSDLITAASVLEDDKAVIAACAEILEREPENVSARLHMLGHRLTSANDESAILKLEDILRSNPVYLPEACRYALRYFHGQKRLEEAKVWQFRLDEWGYQQQAADEERQLIYPTDTFTPHYCPEEYVAKIRKYFRQHKVVGRVYMVRKKVTYLKESPMVVVGITRNRWMLNPRRANAELRQIIALSPYKRPFYFFLLDRTPGLERKISGVEDSLVYKR